MLASAYKNISVGACGDSGSWLNFAGALFTFFFAAVGLGWLLLEPVLPWLPRLDETLSWWTATLSAAFII